MDIWRRAFCAEGPVVSGWCLCFLVPEEKVFSTSHPLPPRRTTASPTLMPSCHKCHAPPPRERGPAPLPPPPRKQRRRAPTNRRPPPDAPPPAHQSAPPNKCPKTSSSTQATLSFAPPPPPASAAPPRRASSSSHPVPYRGPVGQPPITSLVTHSTSNSGKP